MGVIQTYKLTGEQLDDNICWKKVGTVLKPIATDVTVEIPISAGGKIELGSLDAYSRSQIWNYLVNSIFRLGSAQADGDATNATSEGCVIYGENLEGDSMGTSDFSYMRIKPDRIGLYNSKLAGYAGYLFRIDLSSNDCYLRDNAGVKTLQFNRLTGELIINGDLKLQDDQKIVFGLGSNVWWDNSSGELRLDTTISGVPPTEDYHLTTKCCVNSAIKDSASVARTCFVSPEFLTDTTTKRFPTISGAVSYVTSQVPTSITPWLIHIYPGTYFEDRGVWVDDNTTSSIVIPDYCFLVGADRDAVIISPDSNVPGEDMNLFGAILEKDKSASASSHIGFSNLTISGCLYGDAIQVDSFIKKPDYPEFRVYVDNVKIINCNTGVKCEERNSWGYINNIYLEDCDIGLHVDDAKMFCNNVVIRQKNSISALSKGLYSEDKKGKIQVFGLEIGIDLFGLDVAFAYGMHVKDKAEIHVYGGRVDNTQTALFLAEEGEFKGWNVKFHDSQDYDVDMSDVSDNSVEMFAGEFDSPINNDGGDLKLRNCDINTDDISAHTIQWGSDGKLEILSCNIKSAGQISTVDYNCINFTKVPSSCRIISSAFRYEDNNDRPDYLIYSPSLSVSATIISNAMEVGMNGNIKRTGSSKYVNGARDYYSTIQDAIDAAVAGNVVIISPGTYTEQITMKSGVKINGVGKEICILERTELPISWNHGVWVTIEDMTIRTSIQGNDIARPTNGIIEFKNCTLDNGTINIDGSNMTGNVGMLFRDCLLVSNNSATYSIRTVGDSVNSWCMLQAWSTSFGEPGGGIYWDIQRSGSGWGNVFNLTDCILDWGHIVINRDSNPKIIGGSYYSEHAGAIFQISTSKGVQFSGVYFRGGDEMIHFASNPSSFQFVNNFCASTWADYDIDADVTITDANIVGNGMNKGLSGKIQILAVTKNVGAGQDFYKTIQGAVDASSSGDIALITSGTYTEQVTLKNGVTIRGLNKENTIIQYFSDIILSPTNYDTSNIENLTLQVSTIGNRIINLERKTMKFDNCIFKDGYLSISNVLDHVMPEFQYCDFAPTWGVDAINVNNTGALVKFVVFTLDNCWINGKINFKSVMGELIIKNSKCGESILFDAAGTSSYNNIVIEKSIVSSMMGELLTVQQSGVGIMGRVSLISNEFRGESGLSNVLFKVNPSKTLFTDNTFSGAGTNKFDIDVATGITVTNAVVLTNIMTKGIGGLGIFQHLNPIKFVGGCTDFYSDIQHALNSVSCDNSKIILNADQTLTSALTPLSYHTMIDGNHQFNITRSVGNSLMTLNAGDDIKFVNIDLIGSIDVSGNNVKLQLADYTYLNGMVDIQGGNTSTEIKLDQCKITADSADKYCVRINDADPTVIVKRSNLKGDTGDEAIYWNINNNNVKIAYSSIMHGSVGTNTPFGTVSGTINVASHHNIYNTDPFGLVWTNTISGSNDTFDPDGDF